MIRLTEQTSVNVDHISSMRLDTRHYVNGSETTLEVRMIDGTLHRISHGYGIDVFTLKDRIERAAQGGE